MHRSNPAAYLVCINKEVQTRMCWCTCMIDPNFHTRYVFQRRVDGCIDFISSRESPRQGDAVFAKSDPIGWWTLVDVSLHKNSARAASDWLHSDWASAKREKTSPAAVVPKFLQGVQTIFVFTSHPLAHSSLPSIHPGSFISPSREDQQSFVSIAAV